MEEKETHYKNTKKRTNELNNFKLTKVELSKRSGEVGESVQESMKLNLISLSPAAGESTEKRTHLDRCCACGGFILV